MESRALKKKMDDIKDSVLNRVLIVVMIVMMVGITISLLRVSQTGFIFNYGVQIFLAVVIVLLYILRNKLKTGIKGGIFLSVMLVLAMSGLLSFGLYGFGYTYFIPASAIAFVYFSRRTGWIISLLGLAVLLVVASLFNQGAMGFSPSKSDYMESLPMWLNMIITVTLIASVITMFWSNLFSLLNNTFLHISHQQDDMMKMNEQLIVARDKAQESDRLKSSFLANISHEIRTPLNIIIGFSDMLSQTDDPQEKEEFNRVIKNNSAIMLKMVNDIVDFSKIETGNLSLNSAPFNVGEVLCGIEKRLLWKKAENVSWRCEPTDVKIVADKTRVEQILYNMVENAFKFTQQGEVSLSCVTSDRYIALIVSDTGIGISDEDKDRIFDRFYKVDTFFQGAGLGLSISKSIANLMGGDLLVESTPGEGSVFRLKLPLQ